MLIALSISAIYAVNIHKTQKHKEIANLVLLIFSVEMLASVFGQLGWHNVWLYSSYKPVEMWLVLAACRAFFPGPLIRKITYVGFALYALVFLIDGLFIERFENMSGPSNYINGLILIVVALACLIQLFNRKEVTSILQFSGYFLVSGILIYRSTNFVVFVMFNTLIEQVDYDIYAFQHIGSVFRYVLLIFAMRWNQNPMLQRTSLSSAP